MIGLGFNAPFLLVGIGLIGLTAYAGLALFNPTVEATLDPPQVPPGGTFTASWTLQGRAVVGQWPPHWGIGNLGDGAFRRVVKPPAARRTWSESPNRSRGRRCRHSPAADSWRATRSASDAFRSAKKFAARGEWGLS